MPKLSKKGIDIPVSPIRKLVAFSEQAKARGVKVLHLNIGQPDIEAPRIALDAVKKSNLKLLPYGPSQGNFSYRKKLSKYYSKHNININAEDILITTGASEALTFVYTSICVPEVQIILPQPF